LSFRWRGESENDAACLSPERSRLEITVAWTTLLKIFVAGLLAYLAFRLWQLVELLLLALLIAVAFQPLIEWTRRKGWPKWGGVLVCALMLLENYFIVPKVYGNRLKISTLTVLMACLAAGLVAGVVGVILILPVVASYPILERIWLEPYLGRGTVEKHARLAAEEHPEK
jgi:predicted PurR-regulated permease PerM